MTSILINGFRLEEAFSEFKTSPAAHEKGVSCQDCHMGKEPGVESRATTEGPGGGGGRHPADGASGRSPTICSSGRTTR